MPSNFSKTVDDRNVHHVSYPHDACEAKRIHYANVCTMIFVWIHKVNLVDNLNVRILDKMTSCARLLRQVMIKTDEVDSISAAGIAIVAGGIPLSYWRNSGIEIPQLVINSMRSLHRNENVRTEVDYLFDLMRTNQFPGISLSLGRSK